MGVIRYAVATAVLCASIAAFFRSPFVVESPTLRDAAIYLASKSNDYLYSFLPHVPAEHFQAFGTQSVKLASCVVLPKFVSKTECVSPKGTKDHLVYVATSKGGSVLGANLVVYSALRCALCVGNGERINGFWPPPAESSPSYDSDVTIAVAMMDGWEEYARRQAARKGGKMRCVVVIRDPLSRFESLVRYALALGEWGLSRESFHLKRLLKRDGPDEAVRWAWNAIGNGTMTTTHAYLLDALHVPECTSIRVEDVASNFDETTEKMFSTWGVSSRNFKKKILPSIKRADYSSKTQKELMADHHHTSSKVSKGDQLALHEALMRRSEIVEFLSEQAVQLGYAPYV